MIIRVAQQMLGQGTATLSRYEPCGLVNARRFTGISLLQPKEYKG